MKTVCNVLLSASLVLVVSATFGGEFRAGCHAIDVTPRSLPAIVNGGFLERKSATVEDPLFARCLVLSDAQETIAIAIVDSCMIPRSVCDAAKDAVARRTGMATNRILIAATHTHSAPSVMDHCLGSGQDHAYTPFLIERIVEGVATAYAKLSPARVGWATRDAPNHTHSRRWLRREGRYLEDPFGDTTVRAMMHPGYQNPEYDGPAGPVDSQLSVLGIETTSGRPLCVLANYSMHYFGGTSGISSDYFGDFCRFIEQRLSTSGPEEAESAFVAMMSQGTSGDLHWMNYAAPRRETYSRQQYAEELGSMVLGLFETLSFRDDVELGMAETELALHRRQPSESRLAWAHQIMERRGGRPARDRTEVYAEQAVWLSEHPRAHLKLQAIRIGEMAIATMPNEVYAITGLKLKEQSPIRPLFNFELANGAEGYIPPAEQHFLGGYTTWPASTAALEVTAEAEIVDALLGLLEGLSGEPRRPLETDFYSPRQRTAIEAAVRAENNRENRGASQP